LQITPFFDPYSAEKRRMILPDLSGAWEASPAFLAHSSSVGLYMRCIPFLEWVQLICIGGHMERDSRALFALCRSVCIAQLLCFAGFTLARAQITQPGAIDGVYNGTYTCGQGPRTLKLSLRATDEHAVEGLFTFYVPPQSHDRAYSYSLKGSYDEGGNFHVEPVAWKTPPPPGYMMVGIRGQFEPGAGRVEGLITNGMCGPFEAIRENPAPTRTANTGAPPPQDRSRTVQPRPQPSAVQYNRDTGTASFAASRPLTPGAASVQVASQSGERRFQRSYYCMEQVGEPPPRGIQYSTKFKVYVSEVFVSSSTLDEITAAWHLYLTNTVHVSSRMVNVCEEVPSRESVKGSRGSEVNRTGQWKLAGESDRWRGVPQERVREYTLIDTQWKHVDPAGQVAGGTIDGIYSGEFFCGNLNSGGGVFKLTLESSGTSLKGVVQLNLPDDLNHGIIHYSVAGTYRPDSGEFHLAPGQWLNEINGRPIRLAMNVFDGKFDSRTGTLTGHTQNHCNASYSETFTAQPEPVPSVAPVPQQSAAGLAGIVGGGKGAAIGQGSPPTTRRDQPMNADAKKAMARQQLCNESAQSWPMKSVQFVNADIVRALDTGHLECIAELRWQVMSYIAVMNRTLGQSCPNIYDKSVTDIAEGRADARSQDAAVHSLEVRSIADMRLEMGSQALFRESGEQDARALYEHAPGQCGGKVLKSVMQNMNVYERSH
jgi:protein-tyrosine-phosphatase